ncbi:MAG: PD40 domain-containing protein [Pyrinomonadaceae bacterium]|nr:PD40 domain-containing protein [Blastocatellia bacterium]MCW5958022.1 PD40 domain-containing protein [Pyrinomonadaceae bacterium]
MKLISCLVFVFFSVVFAFGQGDPMWLRYPAISPDGKTILFEYKGDIWSVDPAGGNAIPLTVSESYEFAPVWSHDGRSIAFASDRYGNFDVFVMPATGGEAKRLTYHSTREVPSSFTADDTAILFNAARQDSASNVQFPTGGMSELYSVPAAGGRVSLVLTTPALDATVDATGDKIIFHDYKGYESDWRKHHTSSVTRDVWAYDVKTGKYTQLSTFKGEDRNPVFDSNNNDFYYLSEQGGSFNVYKSSISRPDRSTALTKFTKNPVRFLTRSKSGTLAFGYDGEIYTMKPGSEPTKVRVRIAVDGRDTIERIVPVNGGFTEAKLSPNGKEFAFGFRGEIFVSSIDGKVVKRITNTPWQERSVSFSPDGRSLVYAAEKDNNWNVYTVSLTRKSEPYFYVSTVLKDEPAIATSAEEFQPAFSPDGKEIAYLENRNTLKVYNIASKQSRTVLPADKNYSYADGDQYYTWSPDSKWLLVSFGPPQRIFTPEVGIVSADGSGEVRNLTQSGYDDVAPKWAMDGKMMIWGSSREGTLAQGGGATSGDVFGMYFTKAAYDRARLSKEEFALLKEQEEKDKKEADEKAKTASPSASPSPKPDDKKLLAFDWDGLNERKMRLTVHTSAASDYVLSKDGEKLFYLTNFEKGNDLWVTELRTRETKLFNKLGANNTSMELSQDGKFLFIVADGRAMKVDAESGKTEPIGVNTEMVLNYSAEKAYIFDHSWRQFRQKLIFPDLQGVDWDSYYTVYKKFLPYINNNYDFAEMMSEMLGEMNVSHTGAYYRPNFPTGDQTASLGVLFDYSYTGSGAKIAEVIQGGPLDVAASAVKAGNIIEQIDGTAIDASMDLYKLLNRKAGKMTLLSLYDPSANKRWEEAVKPINGGEEGELLYKRWVRNRRAETERLSGGKIGYVHVRAMNDASMRTVVDEMLGLNIGKDAVIVDTRFNGGGGIHEQLSDFLSGKKYFDVIPHGQYVGSEPFDKWVKPSIVLVGESNYSDAHLFPLAYKLKNIGRILGMPVPGTGTFVWWENQIDPTLRYGIPMGCWQTPDGKCAENVQMEPDILVRNEPEIMSGGRDQQIEAAVKELLKK